MVYLLQAEEREISYELFHDLAAVLMESPGVALADATRTIHNSYGIIAFESKDEAERVSARFASLNLRTFLVDHLLDLAAPELLHLKTAKVTESIELAAAARVEHSAEHEAVAFDWLRTRRADADDVAFAGLAGSLRAPGGVAAEDRIEQAEPEYLLDLFAGPHHWRLEDGSAGPFIEFMKGLALSEAALGAGAKNLLAGNRALPHFPGEKEYDRYLEWLYQLRYAGPRGQGPGARGQ